MPESIPTRLDDLIANETPVRVGDRHSQWSGRIVAYSGDPTILLEALDGRRVMLPTSFEISELSGEELRVYNATKEANPTFVLGPTEPTRENTGTGLMSDTEVEKANGRFGYLRRISGGHRLFTYDLTSGDVSFPPPGIMGDEGARIAASVLPGLTAEQVATFYAEWLSADEDPTQPADDGDNELSQAMVATLPLMLMDETQVTFRRAMWQRSGSPSVSMPREQWVNLGSPATITVTIKPEHS